MAKRRRGGDRDRSGGGAVIADMIVFIVLCVVAAGCGAENGRMRRGGAVRAYGRAMDLRAAATGGLGRRVVRPRPVPRRLSAGDPTVQMDLFAPEPDALCGTVTAPAPPGGTKPPPRRCGAADGALEPCTVVGAPVCYRGDCRHWSDGCRHPDDGNRTRLRRIR